MSFWILGSSFEMIFLERAATNDSLSEQMTLDGDAFSSNNWKGLIFSVAAILSITSGGGKEAPHSMPFM